MAFQLKIKDRNKLRRNLKRRTSLFRASAKMEMLRGGDLFIQRIRQRWYSGRKGGDIGLNQDTRDLFRNWFASVFEAGDDIGVNIRNAMLYAKFHEFENIAPRLKKRSFVTEDIKGLVGVAIFTLIVRQLLKEAF